MLNEKEENEKNIGYTEGDIILLNEKELKSANENKAITLNNVVIILCMQGECSFLYNETKFNLSKHSVAILFPKTTINIENTQKSDDLQCKVMVLSTHVHSYYIYSSKNFWRSIYEISRNPIVNMNEEEFSVLENYYNAISIKIKAKSSLYTTEIMQTLLNGLLLEIMSVSDQQIGAEKLSDASIHQGDILFINFLSLLSTDYARLRTVAEFAAELNVSPKYLSSVVKTITGYTALDIIHQNLLKCIVRDLRYSSKSIKEISSELNFPNISFFGKFVKRELGFSPRKFRKEWSSE